MSACEAMRRFDLLVDRKAVEAAGWAKLYAGSGIGGGKGIGDVRLSKRKSKAKGPSAPRWSTVKGTRAM